MKPQKLMQTITFAIKNNLPMMITGAPGVGKSDIVSQACMASEAELIISHPVVSDPTDYKGLPFPDPNGKEAHFLPFGELNKLINASKPTVFFLDDLGQAPASVQASCMQLILARRVNGFKISDQVTFIAATNRRGDKAGVQGILEPVKSRFAAILELTPDVDDWVDWAIKNDMPTTLISFIRYRPELLHKFTPTASIENSPSPRTIANVGKLMNLLGNANVVLEVYAGAAGKGFATELIAFIEIAKDLPDIQYILSSPSSFAIPANPAQQYALCGVISHYMKSETVKPLSIVIERLPKEFQVMAVLDASKRCPSYLKSNEYASWIVKNQNLIVEAIAR